MKTLTDYLALQDPRPTTVHSEDVDAAYLDRLVGGSSGEFFKPFRVEDRPYPDELRKAARVILPALARAEKPLTLEQITAELPSGAADENALRLLLACLEEDYDLQRPAGTAAWAMGSKVLADRFRNYSG